jgi:hypothetical protein
LRMAQLAPRVNHLAHVVPLAPLALQQMPGKLERRAFVFGRRAAHGYSGYSKSKGA